jgi:rubrerythrin
MKTPAELGKNRKKPTDLGPNRTGADRSPANVADAVDYASKFVTPVLMPEGLTAARVQYSLEAEPSGSMAPPSSAMGKAASVVQALKGNNASVFLDLLAERLAFERTGTRIYESILIKFDAGEPRTDGPSRAELEQIRDDEISHFLMLTEVVRSLGADPTLMSPSADAVAVASSGIVKLVQDPHTTLTQALKGALMAELTDNESWTLLADLATQLGHDEIATRFRAALEVEERHLEQVRAWVVIAAEGQAGVDDAEADEEGEEEEEAAAEDRPIG